MCLAWQKVPEQTAPCIGGRTRALQLQPTMVARTASSLSHSALHWDQTGFALKQDVALH